MSLKEATPNTGSVRDQLRTRGYAVLPRLLPANEVARLRDAVTAVYEEHGWIVPGEHDEAGPVPRGNHRIGVPGWFRFIQDVQSLEAFHRLAHHPALAGTTRGIVGKRVLNHPRRHLTPVDPGFWVPPHQEFTYIQGSPRFVTAFVPLTTFTAGECELRLATTFERTVRPLRRTETAGVEAVLPSDAGWTPVPLRPGDVVLISSLAVRTVTENTTDRLKLAVQYRYQPAGTPVCLASIKPEHYPRLPDWNVVAKGWQSKRWIVPPLLPRLVDYRLPATIDTWHEVFAADDLADH